MSLGDRSARAATVVRPPDGSHISTTTSNEGVSVQLTPAHQATIWNGSTDAIRVGWAATATATSVVSTATDSTNFYMATGARFDFVPQDENEVFVYIEAEAGAGAEAWVWVSSPDGTS